MSNPVFIRSMVHMGENGPECVARHVETDEIIAEFVQNRLGGEWSGILWDRPNIHVTAPTLNQVHDILEQLYQHPDIKSLTLHLT